MKISRSALRLANSSGTYWITKYAATRGIFAVEGKIYEEKWLSSNDHQFFRLGSEAFDNIQDARANARLRLKTKAAALRRQAEAFEAKLEDPQWPPMGR